MHALCVIPARYGSTRLPAKPLADLGGLPLIRRVFDRAAAARSTAATLVATDDARIAAVIVAAGGQAVMTSPELPSGTARVAAVARRREDGEPTVPSTLAEEKATNPFLRCREPVVAAAALGGHGAWEDPVRIFAALRQWRNEF